MQMVITNAWKGDPYPIDVLFMYMANMGWNSAMNVPGTIRMLTDKDEATGEYRIPKLISSDALYSQTVPYADLVLPRSDVHKSELQSLMRHTYAVFCLQKN